MDVDCLVVELTSRQVYTIHGRLPIKILQLVSSWIFFYVEHFLQIPTLNLFSLIASLYKLLLNLVITEIKKKLPNLEYFHHTS